MVVVNNITQLQTVRSQFERILLDHDKQCASSIVSSVVAKILNTRSLRKDWYNIDRDMSNTIFIYFISTAGLESCRMFIIACSKCAWLWAISWRY